jgi:very-short-patch-repair endonuclease
MTRQDDSAALPPPSAGEGGPRRGSGEGSAASESDSTRLDSRRFAPITPRLRTFAKEQRHLRTNAEDLFWQQVRAGRFRGLKFRRQAPIPPFIADFLCASARLIVELDGEPHEAEERRRRDAKRDAWLKAQGFEILRFPNELVLMNLGAVLDAVGKAVEARLGRDRSGSVAPLSRPPLTRGPPSPAEGGGDARRAFSSNPRSSSKHAALPPPSAGEGTLRSRGGEGQRDDAGNGARRDPSGSVTPHSRPPLTRGQPSPAEGGGEGGRG